MLISLVVHGACILLEVQLTYTNKLMSVLALSIGMPFWFDIPLTVVSAAVALSASFLALGSELIVAILKRRRLNGFMPLNISTPDSERTFDEDSAADLLTRSSFSGFTESNSSSALAEVEALLYSPEDEPHLLSESWAKEYLVTRLLWTFWYSCTPDRVVRGFGLGLVFITMHYTGSMLLLLEHI
jgi:hypothetical protein